MRRVRGGLKATPSQQVRGLISPHPPCATRKATSPAGREVKKEIIEGKN